MPVVIVIRGATFPNRNDLVRAGTRHSFYEIKDKSRLAAATNDLFAGDTLLEIMRYAAA